MEAEGGTEEAGSVTDEAQGGTKEATVVPRKLKAAKEAEEVTW